MTAPATCKVLALNVYIFEKETIKFSTMLTLWVLNCIGWAVSVLGVQQLPSGWN